MSASFSVSAQAPNSAITAPTGVGVASTVHLNPMQLMAVDASHARHIQGIQPAPISTQGIQPAPIGTPGIQPAPIGTQGIHSATPISTQGLQPASVGTQQPPPEGKTSGNLMFGMTLGVEKRETLGLNSESVTCCLWSHNFSKLSFSLCNVRCLERLCQGPCGFRNA